MLHAKGVGSRDEVVQLELERDGATASLKGARATYELARLDLESTRLTAPIPGRVGDLQVAPGNRVVAGDTVLATITSLDPMGVAFDIDEHTALTLLRERCGDGSGSSLGPGRPVLMGLADEVGFPRRGQVESVDTQFDSGTASLRWRVAVSNSDGLLMPGLFARVRLTTSAPRPALLVRGGATRKDGQGDHVFVVNDRGLVERRLVRLGGMHDGLREVKSGLKEGDWVIVAGFDTAKAGTAVKSEKVPMPGSALVSP